MRKKSCQKDWPQFPEACDGIQVNCCKFITCGNFGVDPEEGMVRHLLKNSNNKTSKRQPPKHHPLYTTSGTGKNEASVVCKSCKKAKKAGETRQVSYTMKSNKAVNEEYQRISSYLMPSEPKCPNLDCSSNTDESVPLSLKKRGFTHSGSQRYQCMHCRKSFTHGIQTRKHRRPEINIRFFDLLMMHAPLRKIAKHLNISEKTIYDKIEFLHRQCMAFVAERERRLLDGQLRLDRLYLATDRMVQILNWTKREDKRNTELYGIGTACLKTGYVFAFNFNFDGTLTQAEVERTAREYGDTEKPKHHRETARIWLNDEFAEATAGKLAKELIPSNDLLADAAKKLEIDLSKEDMTSSENFDEETQLPANGVLIHNEYTMMGHFLFLKNLLQHVGKTRFYMDQDSGMANAYLSIFKSEIKQSLSDGFLVRAVKNMSVDDKRRALADTNRLIYSLVGRRRSSLSSKEFREVVNGLILEELNNLAFIPKSTERWLTYPIATMPEPSKIVAAITNVQKYEPTHQANLYRKASLHAIDRFFMISRRDVNLLERPFSSGSNAGRVWNGYSAYNPMVLVKLADIYRVYFNYINVNDKRQTPAMRLGLAKGPVSPEKIIYRS